MSPSMTTESVVYVRVDHRGEALVNESDVIVGIGGAAGDGVASAGNTLALSVARQGHWA